MIPITILTGFLGAGKTTILNRIIQENPKIRFGLIINEFGEIGIDSQLIESSTEEVVEISNGCLCCVVRTDLISSVNKLIETGKVDYILIETSGLAEPKPVAETFIVSDLDGRIKLDSIVCLIDATNYKLSLENYQTALDQIVFADILVLNKTDQIDKDELASVYEFIKKANPFSVVLENNVDFSTQLLIDNGKWSDDKLLAEVEEHDHDHHEHEHEHEHHHEHNDVDEVVFITKKILSPDKLDLWLREKFPSNVVRAKGILQLQTNEGAKFFVFQMVGATKTLQPFEPKNSKVNLDFSRIVLIGKKLEKDLILADLDKCVL